MDVGNKRKVSLENFNSEEVADKGVGKKLVKLIVYASFFDALKHQCLHGAPWHLLGGGV